MSVYQNMAYGLKNRKIPKDQIEQRVQDTAKILELEEFLKRKTKGTFRRSTPAGCHGKGHSS